MSAPQTNQKRSRRATKSYDEIVLDFWELQAELMIGNVEETFTDERGSLKDETLEAIWQKARVVIDALMMFSPKKRKDPACRRALIDRLAGAEAPEDMGTTEPVRSSTPEA